MDPRIEASLRAHEGDDAAYVDFAYELVLRRLPELDARERTLGMLADGTLSRATLLYELLTSPEFTRVRELDDAVALGLGARARAEPLRWLQAPPGTDERVIEIPWVLSRLQEGGPVLEVGYAFAEGPYLAGLLRSGVELVGVDLVEREVEGMETVRADVRSLPFDDHSFVQVLLVSTLEHIGADNTVYGLGAEHDAEGQVQALREIRRVLRPGGSLLVTVPIGEPADYGWFRQDDVRGWTRLFRRAGLFIEEQEPYELHEDGWRAEPAFRPEGIAYGDRGPAASAVLCSDLSAGRLRRLITPGWLSRTARRRARLMRYRARPGE
jgi:SAM-dependent methyltransferase